MTEQQRTSADKNLIRILKHKKSSEKELLNAFIKEVKEEFKDENLDYLDFIVDRFLNNFQQNH